MGAIDQQAQNSLQHLVAHVLAHQEGLIEGITYQELAKRIGRLNKYGEGHARGMGKVLAGVGQLLDGLEDDWGEPLPFIQSLVVLKTGPLRGLPSYGVEGFWPGFSDMSKTEKLNRMRTEHQKVVAFGSRWNQVLEALDLPRVLPKATEPSGKRYGKSGESDAHKALKHHVWNNPTIVGVYGNSTAFLEYPLPSLDEVDVLFKSPAACVAVEVKSKVSDHLPSDYERGLYQTVKYAALLEAMAQDNRYDIPVNVRSVLVLESTLPQQYKGLAETLGIDLIENVVVDEG